MFIWEIEVSGAVMGDGDEKQEREALKGMMRKKYALTS